MLGKREINVNDKWQYGGVVYTVERDEETNELYFKHPSERATSDDDIPIQYAGEGQFIYKEANNNEQPQTE